MCIELGQVVTDGPPEKLLADERLVSAYLGQETEPATAAQLESGK